MEIKNRIITDFKDTFKERPVTIAEKIRWVKENHMKYELPEMEIFIIIGDFNPY